MMMGVPRKPIYPDIPLKDLFNQWAEKHPEKTYLIHGNQTLSYGEVNDMARRLSNALLELVLRKVTELVLCFQCARVCNHFTSMFQNRSH